MSASEGSETATIEPTNPVAIFTPGPIVGVTAEQDGSPIAVASAEAISSSQIDVSIPGVIGAQVLYVTLPAFDGFCPAMLSAEVAG